MYVNKSVTVTYLMNLKQGISPVYSPYLESATEAKVNGDSDTYTYTMFDPSNYDHTYRRLTEYVDFKTATQTRYNSYVSTVKNTITSPYLKTTASSESMEKVDEYIAAKGYGAYDINDPAQRLALIYKIKEDFQTDFTYNIDFHYDATHDPVYSFFTVGEGICGNFATASIMVYRRLGITARCAMGFGFNSTGGETTVDSTKAHAWTEVWFDNLGWITVDCTGYDDGHELGGGGYGSGFGGGGLYNVPEIVYGGLVNILYTFKEGAEDTYGDFIVPYCGLGYEDLITCNWELDDPNAVLPDYLDIEVYLTGSGDGARIGNYTYTPHIIVRDKVTGDDVTAEFEFEINPAQEDVSYYVDPRVIYVIVSLDANQYSTQNGQVHINQDVWLTKQTTGLPEGYTLALWQENFSYSEPGSYTDYSYHIYFVISVSDIYEYYSGHGAPSEGLSTDVELLNGNHYLDLDTGDYYLYKNGVWILLGHDDETILFVVMPTYNPVVVLP